MPEASHYYYFVLLIIIKTGSERFEKKLFKITLLRTDGSKVKLQGSLPTSTHYFSQTEMALVILGVPTAQAELTSQHHCTTVDLEQSCQEKRKKQDLRQWY